MTGVHNGQVSEPGVTLAVNTYVTLVWCLVHPLSFDFAVVRFHRPSLLNFKHSVQALILENMLVLSNIRIHS